MEFRKATPADMDYMTALFYQAQTYFKNQGIDQWQNNYPNPEVISQDITAQDSYVLLKDNQILATIALVFGPEKTYQRIDHGKWLSNQDYAAIHRVAVDTDHKGLGFSSIMLQHAETLCLKKEIYSIKADTHQDNKAMQRLLEKNGFQYCGIIYLEDASERIAFEKILTGEITDD